jgi:hypothetical protein
VPPHAALPTPQEGPTSAIRTSRRPSPTPHIRLSIARAIAPDDWPTQPQCGQVLAFAGRCTRVIFTQGSRCHCNQPYNFAWLKPIGIGRHEASRRRCGIRQTPSAHKFPLRWPLCSRTSGSYYARHLFRSSRYILAPSSNCAVESPNVVITPAAAVTRLPPHSTINAKCQGSRRLSRRDECSLRRATSVPAPTFASLRGLVGSKCRRHRNTSKSLFLV